MQGTRKGNGMVNLKWKVVNQEIRELDGYAYDFFNFRFRLCDQELQEEFSELVSKDDLFPEDICNFFLEKGIWYTLKFRYIPEGKFDNVKAYFYVKRLNKIKRKIYHGEHKQRLMFHSGKAVVDGKSVSYVKLELYNRQNGQIHFIQLDNNIAWKPAKINEDTKEGTLTSGGWLFFQAGVFHVNFRDRKGDE